MLTELPYMDFITTEKLINKSFTFKILLIAGILYFCQIYFIFVNFDKFDYFLGTNL